jgi:hypothetical protein
VGFHIHPFELFLSLSEFGWSSLPNFNTGVQGIQITWVHSAWLDMIMEVGASICTSFEPFSLSSNFNTGVQEIQSTWVHSA